MGESFARHTFSFLSRLHKQIDHKSNPSSIVHLSIYEPCGSNCCLYWNCTIKFLIKANFSIIGLTLVILFLINPWGSLFVAWCLFILFRLKLAKIFNAIYFSLSIFNRFPYVFIFTQSKKNVDNLVFLKRVALSVYLYSISLFIIRLRYTTGRIRSQ